MSTRRVYKSGNSYVLTIGADELIHLGFTEPGYVRLTPRRNKTIVLQKAPSKSSNFSFPLKKDSRT